MGFSPEFKSKVSSIFGIIFLCGAVFTSFQVESIQAQEHFKDVSFLAWGVPCIQLFIGLALLKDPLALLGKGFQVFDKLTKKDKE